MTRTDFQAAGVPADCYAAAVAALRAGYQAGAWAAPEAARFRFAAVAAAPDAYVADPLFGHLAAALCASRAAAERFGRNPLGAPDPDAFPRWGGDFEAGALRQMRDSMSVPVAVAGALMPDAHQGYAMPVGGVLAVHDAVIPYAVGVDIGCRMHLSVTDLPPAKLADATGPAADPLAAALVAGTVFGMGGVRSAPAAHPVLDADWKVSPVTAAGRDKAARQLGTSGSGNHFAEWGVMTLAEPALGLPAGEYVALLSHSGSRGVGAAVAGHYSKVAEDGLPPRYADLAAKRLAWLPLASEAGRDYWAAMTLMGEYAAACHAVLHDAVLRAAGAASLATVENHHNFAWIEDYRGSPVVVHRKGATPAGAGVLGVIPGSMATPAFVVRGRGNAASLNSASHGAGRAMSRTAAAAKFSWDEWKPVLAKANVRLIGGGIDEVPGSYKDIHAVMAAQADLVEVIGRFDPRIVRMSDDGTAED